MMQKMKLSDQARQDLLWWINNIKNSFNYICRQSPVCTIYTDSSLIGWGAILGVNKAGDSWTATEKNNHINYLELLAVFLACK